MRRRSAAAVSTTTPRSDSSSAIRRSSSSEGDSSPRTIARSALARPRTMNGSTGHSTNRPVSVTTNVAMPHGSRISSYRTVRQPTGSLTAIHRCGQNPSRPRSGSLLGSSTRTPSSFLARARSSLPSSREPMSPSASSGNPITVTVSPAPVNSIVTV